jgi:hypothetical protein
MLITPFKHLRNVFTWMWTRIILLYMQIMYNSWKIEASGYNVEDYENGINLMN